MSTKVFFPIWASEFLHNWPITELLNQMFTIRRYKTCTEDAVVIALAHNGKKCVFMYTLVKFNLQCWKENWPIHMELRPVLPPPVDAPEFGSVGTSVPGSAVVSTGIWYKAVFHGVLYHTVYCSLALFSYFLLFEFLA